MLFKGMSVGKGLGGLNGRDIRESGRENMYAHTFLLALCFRKAFIYKKTVCSASAPLRTEGVVKILNGSENTDSV